MRLKLRDQIVGLVLVLLVGALAAWLPLARNLIVEDRLALAFEMNSAVARQKSDEVQARLEDLTARLALLGESFSEDRRAGRDLMRRLTRSDMSMLALEVWERPDADAPHRRRLVAHNEEAMSSRDLTVRRLTQARQGTEDPVTAAASEGVWLSNTSLPPDAPMLTLAMRHPRTDLVVVAVLDAGHLLRLFSPSSILDTWLVDGLGRVLLHSDRAQMVAREDARRHPLVVEAIGGDAPRGAKELRSGDADIIGAWSRVGIGRLTVLTVTPKAEVLQAYTALRGRSLTFGIMVLCSALILGVFLARRVTAPLARLEEATAAISRGDFGQEVPTSGHSEVARLGERFNQMSRELAAREQRIRGAHSEQMALLGTVAVGIAHEINNPLAYVRGNIAYLSDTLPETFAAFERIAPGAFEAAIAMEDLEDIRAAIGEALEGTDRIRRVVQDLEALRHGHGDEMSAVDVRDVLEGALKVVWPSIKYQARVNRQYGSVPSVHGNVGRLSQVLLNLIVNAAQAMPEGAMDENELRLCTRISDDGRVSIEIGDTGVGIPESVRARIFDPFFTTKEAGQGRGLGLSICHAIVDQMGGEIEVDSEVGAGTTFRILLPVAEAPMTRAPMPLEPQAQAPVSARHRVLVIDDEAAIGRIFARVLKSEHDVTVVDDPTEALEVLRQDSGWDVLFCDLMMPRVTGMDIYGEVCAESPHLADRFVFMTGGAFTPRARDFIDAGDKRYVHKPVDFEEIRAILRTTGQRDAA